MREVLERRRRGDDRASIALAVYTYRIRKYIGAYLAALGTLDLLVFTAGVGENAPEVRADCCSGLEKLGISIDAKKNSQFMDVPKEISSAESDTTVLVVPTNEELEIARETKAVIRAVCEQ